MDVQGLQYVFTTQASSDSAYKPFVVPGATDIQFRAKYVVISQVDTTTVMPVYVNLMSTTCTTGDWQVLAGSTETVFVSRGGFNGISYCSIATTVPKFRVVAIR